METTTAKTIDANEAYRVYHVTRAWLRENRNAKSIRCAPLFGLDMYGKEYIRYLYNVADIEREIQKAVDAFQISGNDRRPDVSGERRQEISIQTW